MTANKYSYFLMVTYNGLFSVLRRCSSLFIILKLDNKQLHFGIKVQLFCPILNKGITQLTFRSKSLGRPPTAAARQACTTFSFRPSSKHRLIISVKSVLNSAKVDCASVHRQSTFNALCSYTKGYQDIQRYKTLKV